MWQRSGMHHPERGWSPHCPWLSLMVPLHPPHHTPPPLWDCCHKGCCSVSFLEVSSPLACDLVVAPAVSAAAGDTVHTKTQHLWQFQDQRWRHCCPGRCRGWGTVKEAGCDDEVGGGGESLLPQDLVLPTLAQAALSQGLMLSHHVSEGKQSVGYLWLIIYNR